MNRSSYGHLKLAQKMVDQQLRARGIRDPAVLEVMGRIARHQFVPQLPLSEAYADRALPTAEGQTISQPYMVAVMTEQLRVRTGLKVLEVGTGSGYQAAILAQLGVRVVSIDRSEYLAKRASDLLRRLGWAIRVQVVTGDGTLGYQSQAPYDRILVTAGAPHLPQAYREQLANDGRIVIPIGTRQDQTLVIVDRHGDQWHSRSSTRCRFVPLVGEDGWSE